MSNTDKALDEILQGVIGTTHGNFIEAKKLTYSEAKQAIQALITEARIDEVKLSGQVFAFFNQSQEFDEDVELPILHDNGYPRKEEMLHNRATIAETTLKHLKARLKQLKKKEG